MNLTRTNPAGEHSAIRTVIKVHCEHSVMREGGEGEEGAGEHSVIREGGEGEGEEGAGEHSVIREGGARFSILRRNHELSRE